MNLSIFYPGLTGFFLSFIFLGGLGPIAGSAENLAFLRSNPVKQRVGEQPFPRILVQQSRQFEEDPEYKLAIPLLKEGRYREALPLLEKALQKSSANILIKADYLLCLVWTGSYEKASHFYLRNEKDLSRVNYVPKHAARAFFETGNFPLAKQLYEQAFHLNSSDVEALKGLIYSLCRLGEHSNAYGLIEKGFAQKEISSSLLSFLKAYVFHHQGKNKEGYQLFAELSLAIDDEGFLKEAQNNRKEVASSLAQEEIHSLTLESQHPSLLPKLLLMDTGRYQEALADFPPDPDLHQLPLAFLLELGWALFKVGRYDESIKVYQFIIEKSPSSCLARIGLVYPLGSKGKVSEGYRILEDIWGGKWVLIDSLFAEAFLLEKEKKLLDAIEVYEELLQLSPKNINALKLKIQNIADLGATTPAYQEALRNQLQEKNVMELLDGNIAVDKLSHDEVEEARKILERQLQVHPANLRARYDYIVTLRRLERMTELIEQWEAAKLLDPDVPYWVTAAVADAYLYLEKPAKALDCYKTSLRGQIRFNTLLGLFYTYQELRDWENAEKNLQEIESFLKQQKPAQWSKIKDVRTNGWFLTYEDKLREILDYYEFSFKYLETRGWLLIYQDQLKDAEKYFSSFTEKAGMSSDFRNGLAHVYLWRGQPRLALEEFKIIANTDPKYWAAQNGMALALNNLNYKKEARDLAQKLSQQYPANKHVYNTYRSLQVEEMNVFSAEAGMIHEVGGAEEYWLKSSLMEPLSPTFSLFQEVLWQKASDEEGGFYWNRAGLGGEWIVLPQLVWKQAVTLDYQKLKDWGYYTTLTWRPTDPLQLTAGYDSFWTDIPIRARAEGIEGENAFGDVYYHESDLRDYGFTIGSTWFSDGNQSTYFKPYLSQNVLNKPDFKIRLGAEFYYAKNQKTDVSYFSPAEEYSLVATAAFHWTHYLIYNKLFRSSFYSRLGLYKQSGNGYYPVGGLTYEQSLATSKTFSLVWNISWDRKVYDGNSTSVWSGLVRLRKNF